MNGMGSFFGIVGVGAGIYCIYGYMLMIRKRQIPKGIMLPKDEDPKKCKDVEAYIKMTSTQLLLVGVLLVAYGVMEFINTYAVAIPIPIFAVMHCWTIFTRKHSLRLCLPITPRTIFLNGRSKKEMKYRIFCVFRNYPIFFLSRFLPSS